MKTSHFALFLFSFFIEVRPVLIDMAVLNSPRTAYYLFGDDHEWIESEKNLAQLDMFAAIFDRAEKQENLTYHVMIEQASPFCRRANGYDPCVLKYLYEQTHPKNLKNTIIEDIEVRLESGAAVFILGMYSPEFELNLNYDPKTEIDKELAEMLRQYYPFDLRKLTFQHVLDSFEGLVQKAYKQRDKIESEEARCIFTRRIACTKEHSIDLIERCLRYIKKEETIMQAAERYVRGDKKHDARRYVSDLIISMFQQFVDLNVFFKIQMLEQQKLHYPEQKLPEKVIIITGGAHMLNIKGLLRMMGYQVVVECDRGNFYYVGLERRGIPLRISLLGLIEVSNKNLEWEVQKRAWCPIL